MGNQVSDPIHQRMYSNLIQIKDPHKRVQLIQASLASIEYVQSAKRSGIYSYLLHYVSTVQMGGNPSPLPGEESIQKGPPHRETVYREPIQRELNQRESIQREPIQRESNQREPIQRESIQRESIQRNQITIHQSSGPSWKVITETPKQKAISYFSSCLEVLEIQEEVALTDEALKKAYKRMAIKAHPDKGGSEEYFEAVTRAYAYLSEILKAMRGSKSNRNNVVQERQDRETEAKQWEHVQPVRLNAKNLDMNAFNQMFEQTHMPDPDSDGYGDWLKDQGHNQYDQKSFTGKFNRDVFNRMFEEESRKKGASHEMIIHPGQMALTLNPNSGVDFVSERPSSYTAAPNSKFQFTDLRGAYTSESTISDKISNVAVENRSFDQYRASREKAPDPLHDGELHAIHEFESRQKQQDDMRERKRAEMAVRNQSYFDRMKQMVITDGVDLRMTKK
jgi:curved DNA-binding protein CbpA